MITIRYCVCGNRLRKVGSDYAKWCPRCGRVVYMTAGNNTIKDNPVMLTDSKNQLIQELVQALETASNGHYRKPSVLKALQKGRQYCTYRLKPGEKQKVSGKSSRGS